MSTIPRDTIYTKTAKGVLWSKTVQLSRERGIVFEAVDGEATVAELLARLELTDEALDNALETLTADGYIKVVSHQAAPGAAPDDTDLDFTAVRQPAPAPGASAPAGAEPLPAPQEPPRQEVDLAERVRELNARVRAERLAREELIRRDSDAQAALRTGDEPWPALAFTTDPDAAARARSPAPEADVPGEAAPSPAAPGDDAAHAEHSAALPSVDGDAARELPPPEYVPTALERAMAELAARDRSPARAPDEERTAMPGATAAGTEAAAGAAPEPSLADDEPLHERLSVDRAAYDIIAETAEARRKAEALQLSRDAADAQRRRLEEETRRRQRTARERRRGRVLWVLAAIVVGAPLAALAWLQFLPFNGYLPAVQQSLSQAIGKPVTVSTLRYPLLPTPRLVLEDVRIGEAQGVRARRVEVDVSPVALGRGESRFERVDAHEVEIDAAAIGALGGLRGGGAQDAVQVKRLRFTQAKLNAPGADFGVFDGELVFAEDGALQQALFTKPEARLELTPRPDGVRLALDATSWRLPYGPPVPFGRLVVNGLIDPARIAAAEFTGRIGGGTIEGALTARWSGPISVRGEFNLQQARLQDLTGELMPQFPVRGVLKTSGRFSMQAPQWAGLMAKPQVDANFTIARGELTNVDLVRAIQSPSTSALRGGRTTFDQLSGALSFADSRYGYRQLQLASGALNASGAVTVQGGALSGRLVAELAARGGLVARSMLTIGGTVQDPELKR